MTGLLASVANFAESQLALQAGVDIIDLKAPQAGALGALPLASARQIVAAVGGRYPVSATIGDLPMQADVVGEAVQAMAATGVDYVKIGFFPGGDWPGTINRLSAVAQQGRRLVAVLFADQQPDLAILPKLAEAGFRAAMLDTADKRRGSLTGICRHGFLGEFVQQAQSLGMLGGLAGSLSLADIPLLLALKPDYLGFRGALCRQRERTGELDPTALQAVKTALSLNLMIG